MSRILSITRRTLSYGASLYTPLDRARREGAFQAFIMAFVFSALMNALLGWCIWKLDLFPDFVKSDPVQSLYFFVFHSSEYMMESFGLIALYPFIIAQQKGANVFSSFRVQWSAVSVHQRTQLFLASLTIFLINLVLFQPLLMHESGAIPQLRSIDLPAMDSSSLWAEYTEWIIGLLGSVVHLVPIILLFLLLIAGHGSPITVRNVANHIRPLLAMILSCFLLRTVLVGFWNLVQEHIFPVFTIPFLGSPLPLLLSFMILALVGGYSIPFFAACVHRPLDVCITENVPPRAEDHVSEGHDG